MNNLDWKTRLLIYLLMKKYTPSAPGWLVAAEQAWRLRNIIRPLASALPLSPSVESSWQCILTTSKSVLRCCHSYRARLCFSSILPSTIKMPSITKGYVGVYKEEQNALQAFREHGEEQEILCLRPRAEWPTQADSLR